VKKQTFVNRANTKFNDQYDYSLVEYINATTEISILCKSHNVIFQQTPQLHLKGFYGCPKCQLEQRRKSFISKAYDKFNDQYDYSLVEYVNAITKVRIKCNRHDTYFDQTPDLHLDERLGCPVCKSEQRKQNRANKTYNDRHWLTEQTQTQTIRQMATEAISSEVIIYRRLREFGIEFQRTVSGFEQEVYDFVASQYTGNIIRNNRTIIKPHELDIYIPDLQLAIEVNGDYYHCTKQQHIDKEYHKTKSQKSMNNGIQLIQIPEHLWNQKQDICKSIILHAMGQTPNKIYARNCSVEQITSDEMKTFLKEHHLQGSVVGSIKLGLKFKNELIGVMLFGKSRFHKESIIELLRFAVKKYTHVPGGASKLFTAAYLKYNLTKVLTYSDRDISVGGIYRELKFDYSHTTPPGYKYLNTTNNQIYSRHQFQKHKLPSKLNVFDGSLSEEQNMNINGYYRIYDSGNDVWMWSSC